MKNILFILLSIGTWSLNGTWQFCFYNTDSVAYTEQNCSNTPIAALNNLSWDTIDVPSNWEIAGKKEPEYGGSVADCHGIYRRTFCTPNMQKNSHLLLRFDGVLFAYDLYINDQYVGYHAAAFCRKDWDITTYLAPDGNNTIIVDVSTRSRDLAYRFDLNDDWALTGIFRDVMLVEQPATYIADHTFTSNVVNHHQATVACHTTVSCQQTKGVTCITTLRDQHGKIVAHGDTLLRATLRRPHLWSAEAPYLYILHIELREGDIVVDSLTERVGIREISIKGDTLLLNNQLLTLRGVCMNELHPNYGRAIPGDLLKADLTMMKRANINYIRTAHYPFQPAFYRLCDEMGFYVVCEVPFGYGDSNLTDTAYLQPLFERADATVALNKNHPSVIIWSIGNENPYTPIVEKTIEHVRDLDPTRPRTIPGYKVSNSFLRDSTTDALSLYALHYQSIEKIEDMVSHHRKPIILTEYSHALGLAFDALESQQAMIRRHPSIAGGSVWVWADQALLRQRTATECLADTLPQGIWLDSVTYYDSYNDKGTDGIVFANRYPQEDYFQVRKLYSPVWVEDSNCLVAYDKKGVVKRVSFTVENRYDFLTLRGSTCRWMLTDGRHSIASGSVKLSAAPHNTERVTIPLHHTTMSDNNATILRLAFTDTEGDTIYEHNIRTHFACNAHPTDAQISNSTIDKQTTVTIVSNSGDTLLHSPLLLRVGRKPSINIVNLIARHKLDSYWMPYIIAPEILSCTPDSTVTPTCWTIRARWHRQNGENDEYYEGEVNIQQTEGGGVSLTYDIHSRHATGTILELGLTLQMPEHFDTFAWFGKGPFASTPHKSAFNEYDLWYLHKDDIRLTGNRSDVTLAAVCNSQTDSIALAIVPTSDLGVENINGTLYLTDTRIISSYGTKLSRMMVQQKAHKAKHATGRIVICPLSNTAQAQQIFLPLPSIHPERPFLKIYDH